ncbi:MAG: DNA replication/repair protein RecF [Roseovarius sp.]|nr:DNA replication/repair protein RecF [Roseovarius sp.]MCY4290341.1 DNA replication/repair protein RecF [Roseovarius sp.]MCY4316860.1 DNA replication/repair protein RecF [Roseovarius sp.]
MDGLHVSRLALSHFRSHRSLQISLDSRPVAIHGRNGAGKTNILEALSLLSPGRGFRRAKVRDMANNDAGAGWKVHAAIRSGGQMHETEFASDDGQARQLKINGKTAPQGDLAEIARVLWLIPAMDRLWMEGAEGRRRYLDRMALGLVPAHASVSIAYEKAMRDRNRLLRERVSDGRWYGALERVMAKAGVAIHSNRLTTLKTLNLVQSVADTAFPSAKLELAMPAGSMPVLEEDFLAMLESGRGRDLAAGRSLLGPHRADLRAFYTAKGMPAAHCSTGEQKALLISLILANARAIAENFGSPPILLLDEVSAHLDSHRRTALQSEIDRLGAQAWMTGTSMELFDFMGDSAQHIAVTERDGISAIEVRP